MQFVSYLTFAGNCEEAFKFYEKVFKGKLEGVFHWKRTPGADMVPAEWGDKVMHARLVIGTQELMGADSPPAMYKKTEGMSVSISVNDVAESERIFSALSENGNVTMPLEKTFWAAKFGMLVDRYGIPWMINCEQPAS